jgi:hypothetical protein
VDFLLLVSSDYSDRRVVVHDSCAHCTDRIVVVIDRGQIVTVDPPDALVFHGGG